MWECAVVATVLLMILGPGAWGGWWVGRGAAWGGLCQVIDLDDSLPDSLVPAATSASGSSICQPSTRSVRLSQTRVHACMRRLSPGNLKRSSQRTPMGQGPGPGPCFVVLLPMRCRSTFPFGSMRFKPFRGCPTAPTYPRSIRDATKEGAALNVALQGPHGPWVPLGALCGPVEPSCQKPGNLAIDHGCVLFVFVLGGPGRLGGSSCEAFWCFAAYEAVWGATQPPTRKLSTARAADPYFLQVPSGLNLFVNFSLRAGTRPCQVSRGRATYAFVHGEDKSYDKRERERERER